MAGSLIAPVEVRKKRTCYSCGSSYPESVRFCPNDSVDLDYLPQPIESLSRDFAHPKRWCAILTVSAFMLFFAGMMLMDHINSAAVQISPRNGELTVRTTPAGARVYLDGSDVGVSPVRLSDIPPGVHEVRAVIPGYSHGKAQVEILPRATQKLVWDLAPLPTRKTKDRNRYLAGFSPENSPAVRSAAQASI